MSVFKRMSGRKRRRLKRGGHFLLCLLFNMLMTLEWSIPAWVLLGLHFLLDISIGWCIAALLAWILGLILWMYLIGWATRCGNAPDPPKENKNPYSVTTAISDRVGSNETEKP